MSQSQVMSKSSHVKVKVGAEMSSKLCRYCAPSERVALDSPSGDNQAAAVAAAGGRARERDEHRSAARCALAAIAQCAVCSCTSRVEGRRERERSDVILWHAPSLGTRRASYKFPPSSPSHCLLFGFFTATATPTYIAADYISYIHRATYLSTTS